MFLLTIFGVRFEPKYTMNFGGMTQIAVFLFWMLLPCAVVAVSVTAILHLRSKQKRQKLFVSSEQKRISELEKELQHYKKAYNKLLCKYHATKKADEADVDASILQQFKHSEN